MYCNELTANDSMPVVQVIRCPANDVVSSAVDKSVIGCGCCMCGCNVYDTIVIVIIVVHSGNFKPIILFSFTPSI